MRNDGLQHDELRRRFPAGARVSNERHPGTVYLVRGYSKDNRCCWCSPEGGSMKTREAYFHGFLKVLDPLPSAPVEPT